MDLTLDVQYSEVKTKNREYTVYNSSTSRRTEEVLGIMGLCKRFYRLVRNFLIVFATIVLLPGLPPKTYFDFDQFVIPKPLDLTGPLELNNLLDNAEHLYEGMVHGPETILKRGDEMYVSSHGGEVMKITGDHVTHVAKFGKACEGITEEAICGRPLGMAFDTIGNNLIVADAYYGLWSVDLDTRRKTQLLGINDELDGKIRRPAKVPNSVAVSKSGDINWTDSSSDFQIQDGVYALLANPSGRLFHYNRATKENKVLLDNLFFANGFAVSPNEEFLVVAETAASRLTRYYLKGAKAGQSDVFIDRLPGTPDNLSFDDHGLWVPLVTAIDSENPGLWQSAANAPLIRKFLIRILALLELPFKTIENVYPNAYTKIVLHKLGHFELLTAIVPARQTILCMDWNGKIIGSLHGFDKSTTQISHVLEDGDYLYLGSFSNKFLTRVKLPASYKSARAPSKAAPQAAKVVVEPIKATPPKPVPTTTPKPATTTTPKPTTTTTPKPATTTTPKPTTTTTPKPATTTTPKPAPTTTPKPAPKTTTAKPATTTQKPAATTTTPKPATTTAAPKVEAKKPAAEKPTAKPIHESIKDDTKKPTPEKMKIIKKGGVAGEL